MTEPVLYGIAHCDTVKKARAWLTERGVTYRFHDFKKQGVPPGHLTHWLETVGWHNVLNRRGTTWRQLDAATQAAVQDAASAADVLLRQPSAIKRPLVEWPDGAVTVGFAPEDWQQRLSASPAQAGR